MSNTRADFFHRVFTERMWNSDESASGVGSTLAAAHELVQGLPGALHQLGVRSLLDLPCGDFNWMKTVDLTGIDYLGGDIVVDVVEQNQRLHAREGVRFQVLDVVQDDLPPADLIFVRDCFIHFTLDLIQAALSNIRRADIKYLCMTNDSCRERYAGANFANIELDRAVDGVNFEYRPLNFQLPPFNFPPPVLTLSDGGAWDGFKSMAIWDIESLPTL